MNAEQNNVTDKQSSLYATLDKCYKPEIIHCSDCGNEIPIGETVFMDTTDERGYYESTLSKRKRYCKYCCGILLRKNDWACSDLEMARMFRSDLHFLAHPVPCKFCQSYQKDSAAWCVTSALTADALRCRFFYP